MKENIPTDLIQPYLKGQLPLAERESFEKLLKNDPALHRELTLQRIEMAASELLIAAETRELFQEWKKPQQKFFGKKQLGWLLALAAGIFLLIAVIWHTNQPEATPASRKEQNLPPTENPAPTPDQPTQPVKKTPPEQPVATKQAGNNLLALAQQHFQEPVLPELRQLSADSAAGIVRQAQASYAAAQYAQTLELLALVDSAQLQSATFLAAHALFHLKKYAQAEAEFTRLIEAKSRQYRYPSEWGLLMCRLANAPTKEPAARQQLREILDNPQHPYFIKAQQLEKQLQK